MASHGRGTPPRGIGKASNPGTSTSKPAKAPEGFKKTKGDGKSGKSGKGGKK